MKVIIFDFDGTIADSFETVLHISNRLATEFGYPVAQADEIEHLKNLSSREIIKRAQISPLKLPFLLLRLRAELNREIGQLNLIPGMKAVLLQLKDEGNCLGIVTSNSCKNVNTFLQFQNLEGIFDFVDSGLALFGKGRVIQQILKRYHLNPETVIYVGDETRDIEAAHKIGIPVIAVTWGFNSSEALATENPEFLIDQPEQLLQALQQI